MSTIVRVIKPSAVRLWVGQFPKAGRPLEAWLKQTGAADWQSLVSTRKMFPHADQVKVQSGKTVTIFNVSGNDFRLITAIHYDTKKVFILRFLTHAEYTKAEWKRTL